MPHLSPVEVESHPNEAPLVFLVTLAVQRHRASMSEQDVVAGDIGLGAAVALGADGPALRRPDWEQFRGRTYTLRGVQTRQTSRAQFFSLPKHDAAGVFNVSTTTL